MPASPRVGSRVLAEPLSAGLFRQCPHCGKWFALKFVRREHIGRSLTIKVYQCRHCERQVDVATNQPPHAV
jgi:phage terminase large subunit GpA-like protein